MDRSHGLYDRRAISYRPITSCGNTSRRRRRVDSAGYNGYGMANAWLSGKHVAGCVLQEKDVETIPSAYILTEERIANMNVTDAAKRWLGMFGLA